MAYKNNENDLQVTKQAGFHPFAFLGAIKNNLPFIGNAAKRASQLATTGPIGFLSTLTASVTGLLTIRAGNRLLVNANTILNTVLGSIPIKVFSIALLVKVLDVSGLLAIMQTIPFGFPKRPPAVLNSIWATVCTACVSMHISSFVFHMLLNLLIAFSAGYEAETGVDGSITITSPIGEKLIVPATFRGAVLISLSFAIYTLYGPALSKHVTLTLYNAIESWTLINGTHAALIITNYGVLGLAFNALLVAFRLTSIAGIRATTGLIGLKSLILPASFVAKGLFPLIKGFLPK